jgi:hypothetical protein
MGKDTVNICSERMTKPTNSGPISESAKFQMENKTYLPTDADIHKPTLLAELEDSTPLMSKTNLVMAKNPRRINPQSFKRQHSNRFVPRES